MFDHGKQSYKTDIKLGDRYRDEQTGIEGVATSVSFFQHACERVCLELLVKGELKEYIFDSPRLTNIASGERATIAVAATGGPLQPAGRPATGRR